MEIAAYYLPWLDNLLDSIATPAAMVAGIVVSAAFIEDFHPVAKWSLAVIAGGGVAGTVKAGLACLRLGSSATTGGMGNPVVSTLEWIGSFVLSVLAILLPVLAAVVAVLLVILFARLAYRVCAGLFGRRPRAT